MRPLTEAEAWASDRILSDVAAHLMEAQACTEIKDRDELVVKLAGIIALTTDLLLVVRATGIECDPNPGSRHGDIETAFMLASRRPS